MRTLHMADGQVVRYRIYRTGTIVFFTPKKHVADASKVTGLSWHEVERGFHKEWLHITPQMCKDYVEKVLRARGTTR